MKIFKNSDTTKARGFTLIELMVSIAIIGILATLVMAALNTSRKRGEDAAIKSEMANMRGQGELFYANNGLSYGPVFGPVLTPSTVECGTATTTNVFGSTSVVGSLRSFVTSVNTRATGSTSCAVTANTWAFSASLSDGTSWCVDSAGASKIGIVSAATSRCN